jgi:hypothetical protein
MTIPRGPEPLVRDAPRAVSPFGLAFFGYTILTLVVLHSIVRHLATQVPHDLGDPLLSASLLWWNAHTTPLTERWWNGFGFWPATGMIAFSDHRLGESVIAAPLTWIGVGPIAAYNVTLLATFPLCAMAAHWLGFTLTGRHDASLIAGLAYGFNPYRVAHLEHLELLAAFGMPAALAALHLYLKERRVRWLVAFGAAVVVQGLCCSYYVVHLAVMVGIWILWFMKRDRIDLLVGVGIAFALVATALSPVAWSYLRIHRHYGFARSFNDIITLSADLSSFVTASPLVALWGWTAPLNDTERQLFPGATIVLLVVLGAGLALSIERRPRAANRAALALTAAAVAFTAIAVAATFGVSWRAGVGGLALSVREPFKPFSIAFLLLSGAVLLSSPVRAARARRSAFAFYTLAAILLAVCCLGPKPRVLGYQFLYEPPYAWLMRIRPIGESMRVPARFAMAAIMALSAAGALGFARVARTRPDARALTVVVAALIVADGWVVGLPMLDPPARWPSRVSDVGASALLELPLGETDQDTEAMFHAVRMQIPTVNGYSGYEPSYYGMARVAMAERDDSVLDAFASTGPLVIVVARPANYSTEALAWMRSNPKIAPIAEDPERAWFALGAQHQPAATRCGGPVLPIGSAWDRYGPVDLRLLTDANSTTFWTTRKNQQQGDSIEFDLGSVASPCSIQFSFGSHVAVYPRRLNVAVSADGYSWQTVFEGATGGAAVMASLQQPLDPRIEIPLSGASARFVRCRLETDNAKFPWIITEVAVTRMPSQ